MMSFVKMLDNHDSLVNGISLATENHKELACFGGVLAFSCLMLFAFWFVLNAIVSLLFPILWNLFCFRCV